MRVGSRSSGFFHVARAGLIAVGPNRKRLGAVSLLALALGVLETTVVYLVARLGLSLQGASQRIELGGGPLPTMTVSLGEGILIAAAVLIVTVGLSYPVARMAAELSRETLLRQRGELMHRYLCAGWDYRSGDREGHLQDLMGDYAARSEKLVDVISTVVVSTSGMLAIGVAALLIAPVAAVVATVGIAVVGVASRPLTRRLKNVSNAWLAEHKKLTSRMAETARVSGEAMAFDVGPVIEQGARVEIAENARLTAELRMFGRLTPLLFLYGAFGLVLLVLGIGNLGGPVDVAAVGPLILLLVRALGYGKQLQTAVQTGIEYAPSVYELEDAIAVLDEHRAPRGSLQVSGIGPIDVEDVGFAYLPGQPVLRDVCFHIAPGDAVAVVGPSGGGKTTLTQLLLRLRQPTTGRIVVGTVDINDIDRATWAELVAFVPQDNQLIHATVADNIRFYRPHLTDSDIEEAARSAHLYDEIAALPQGFDTFIGQGSRGLSGGQRQRLGIARALVGHPEFLVLDEPTSALDQRSEQLIRQVLLELKDAVTMLVVAHRPATMEICDRIIRIDGGVAEEMGTHQNQAG